MVFVANIWSKLIGLTNHTVFSIYVLVRLARRRKGPHSFTPPQNRYATMGLVFLYWIRPRDNLGTHEVRLRSKTFLDSSFDALL